MTTVVVMAGGRGLRLHPLTQNTPKPLLRVGAKPMLEQIVERFKAQGFTEFVFCVNYLAERIVDYFGFGDRLGVDIRYSHESHPLGTAGPLKEACWQNAVNGPFFVINGDVLADLDYRAMLETHWRNRADATVALGLYQQQIPFGVAEIDGERLAGLREKPIEGFLVNAGIYVLNRDCLSLLPDGPSDMPDLLQRLDTVAVHPIEGYWADVGTFEAIVRASQEWNQ